MRRTWVCAWIGAWSVYGTWMGVFVREWVVNEWCVGRVCVYVLVVLVWVSACECVVRACCVRIAAITAMDAAAPSLRPHKQRKILRADEAE